MIQERLHNIIATCINHDVYYLLFSEISQQIYNIYIYYFSKNKLYPILFLLVESLVFVIVPLMVRSWIFENGFLHTSTRFRWVSNFSRGISTPPLYLYYIYDIKVFVAVVYIIYIYLFFIHLPISFGPRLAQPLTYA